MGLMSDRDRYYTVYWRWPRQGRGRPSTAHALFDPTVITDVMPTPPFPVCDLCSSRIPIDRPHPFVGDVTIVNQQEPVTLTSRALHIPPPWGLCSRCWRAVGIREGGLVVRKRAFQDRYRTFATMPPDWTIKFYHNEVSTTGQETNLNTPKMPANMPDIEL